MQIHRYRFKTQNQFSKDRKGLQHRSTQKPAHQNSHLTSKLTETLVVSENQLDLVTHWRRRALQKWLTFLYLWRLNDSHGCWLLALNTATHSVSLQQIPTIRFLNANQNTTQYQIRSVLFIQPTITITITSVGFTSCQTSQYMFLFCLVTTDYTTRFLQSSLSLWAKYNKYKLCLIYERYSRIKYDVRVFVSLQYHRKSLIFELKEAKHARVSAVNSNNCVWALKQTGGLFLCPLIPLQWSLIKNQSTCAVMEISIVTASHSFDPL